MKDHRRQERRGDGNTGVAERRSTPRQQFVAEAQVVEVSSGVRLSARSCDLVVHGCYVDTLIPFPPGTVVRIRLTKDNTIVEAKGNVVYRLPGLGMGIAFHDMSPESRAALDKWLSLTRVEQESLEALFPSIEPDTSGTKRRQPTPEFVELIRLLMKKTILSKTEAIGLLRESLDE